MTSCTDFIPDAVEFNPLNPPIPLMKTFPSSNTSNALDGEEQSAVLKNAFTFATVVASLYCGS